MHSKTTPLLSGYLLIDKLPDWTSQDVITYLRGMVKARYRTLEQPVRTKNIRVGHSGTLDPFATGLLIVGIGREATKQIDRFSALDKTYVATIHLGAVSDTYDRTGDISEQRSAFDLSSSRRVNNEQGTAFDLSSSALSLTPRLRLEESSLPKGSSRRVISGQPTVDQLKKTLQSFIGTQEQLPPMYSAKKIQGQRLYELARKGVEVERKSSTVTVHDIELISYSYPLLSIIVTCSTGTYIRTLAHDIGQALGTGAYCEELERTAIGPYQVKDAVDVKSLNQETWQDHLFVPKTTTQPKNTNQ